MFPTVGFFRQRNFLVTQWRAVGARGVLFVRGTETNDRFDDDQRWFVGAFFKASVGSIKCFQIVGVGDRDDLPTTSFESTGNVFGERKFGAAFDGDFVVVINPTKVGKLQVASQ